MHLQLDWHRCLPSKSKEVPVELKVQREVRENGPFCSRVGWMGSAAVPALPGEPDLRVDL